MPFQNLHGATAFIYGHTTPHAPQFASNLEIAGKSIAKIGDWLGDTERVTERNHAHLLPDDENIHALMQIDLYVPAPWTAASRAPSARC